MQVSPETVRKSGRARQPNRKYANETFTGLEALDSASEHEVELWQQAEQHSDSDEFDEEQALEEANAEDEEEDVVSSAGSDASGMLTPNGHSDSAASDADMDIDSTPETPGLRAQSIRNRPYVLKRRPKRSDGIHVRGITDPVQIPPKGVKPDYIYSLFGDATQDLVHMARSRDQWCHEATLPRRPNKTGTEGMHHSFSHPEEKRQFEATRGWEWYYDHGGHQHLSKSQASVSLGADEAFTHLTPSSDSPRTIFMGPYGRQVRFDLPILKFLALSEAWEQAHSLNVTENNAPDRSKSRKRQDGWLLNVGRGARCIEWAPNHAGDTQYLAVSTFRPKSNDTSGQPIFSPAFTAQSFPASIQIWSFSSTEAPERRSLLDPDLSPCLRLVICTDWGDAKHLRWCPMPRNLRKDGQEARIPIGLLAGVWSDGYVRVLDVHLDQCEAQRTSFVKLTNAAFTAKPPSTLCTCVIWLSPTDLAVGCANGYLALWSIYPFPAPSSSASLPSPYLYTPLHDSYISSLSSAYPVLPHLLASTSPSGHLRLTSLLAPQTDYVLAPRLRHPPSHIHFSEPCQAFIAADEAETLRLWPIRRFFGPITVARCPSQGLALGVGRVHGSVIVGCEDGTVCVTSPMRKFLFPKLTSWQYPVFKHEFARRGGQEGDGSERGRIRITEGYKAQEAPVLRGTGKRAVEGMVVATIYEDEGQVRCVSWGTELNVGGWVAVGMGSGLVRVEDLAI
ncbi:MAG: hypothetical protein L6R38_008827 [Xanthoria sp. 2 TBL-2021]|nr:MAG: hypothetical protein L6R38_008827 [Xanthoria sp. 2 TBL-2021]